MTQVNEETVSARRMESNVLLSEVIALDPARISALVVDKRIAACVASNKRMEYGASMEGAAPAACIAAFSVHKVIHGTRENTEKSMHLFMGAVKCVLVDMLSCAALAV
jgi:hypothetical protein